jgi:peptide/nickel transport system substrate-binding protein
MPFTLPMRRRGALALGAAPFLLPRRGAAQAPAGELRVAVWDLPPSRGNPFGGRSVPSIFVWDALFDPLVRIGESGEPEPALATAWRAEEPTRWRFTLRPGAAFSNGAPCDAEAVAATFAFLTSEAGRRSPVGSELREIASARVVDATTLDILTTEPDPVLPNKLALAYIVEPRLWAQGPDAFAAAPVGTGPFMVESWAPTQVVLAANPRAFRASRLARLRVLGLPERPARLQALQSGQVDVALGLSPDNIGALRSSRLEVLATPAPQVMSLGFVLEGRPASPLQDVRVRQALNLAVDRAAMARELLAGLARPAGQGGTPAAFGYHPGLGPMPTDKARARALLREAGFGNGFRMMAEITVDAFPSDSEIYQQTAMDLQEVGVQLELRVIRFPDWLRKFQANSWDGDAFGISWNTAPYMDTIRPYTYMSCLKRPAHFCDREVMPLIESALSDFDRERRRATLHRLHEATRARPPAIFLVEQVDVTGVSPRVRGFRYVNRAIFYEGVVLG